MLQAQKRPSSCMFWYTDSQSLCYAPSDIPTQCPKTVHCWLINVCFFMSKWMNKQVGKCHKSSQLIIKENPVLLNSFVLIQVALFSCVLLNFRVSVTRAHKGTLSLDKSHAKRMLKLHYIYTFRSGASSALEHQINSGLLWVGSSLKKKWSPPAPFKQYRWVLGSLETCIHSQRPA